MNKNQDLNDRFMDELLRANAQGQETDEELLAAVEAAIDGKAEVVELPRVRKARWTASLSWAALLLASVISVLAFMEWRAQQAHKALAGSPAVESATLSKEAYAGNIFGDLVPQDASANSESHEYVDAHLSLAPVAPASSTSLAALESESRADGSRRMRIPLDGDVAYIIPVLPGEPGDQYQRDPVGDVGGGLFGRDAAPVDRERYGQLVDQPWKTPVRAPLSTFSVDVDTASYANIRRMLQQGVAIPPDAVRIEECINYFDYQYAPPVQGGPFAVHTELATCPWAPEHRLLRIGLKGREVEVDKRPASNLVFLIDVSGSMQDSSKLPLLVESMKILVEELDERDRVGIVVYAGSEGVVLQPTRIQEDGRGAVLAALNNLRAGGSTNGGAGIVRAYELARQNFDKDGVNRVILATDGDFNVGTTGQGDLVRLVKERAAEGVFLSVLGFGSGNINDAMLEAITNDGNGTYYYIDSQKEGRKVFLQDLSGTLVTIAKDVKIQVDFNPGQVAAYRLIGYANRILRDEDFNNDKVDAGDIGAGHTVTALYELVPVGAPVPVIGGVDGSKYTEPAGEKVLVGPADEWLTVKLRYKRPDGEKSALLEVPVQGEPVAWEKASADFQFAAGVACFGMKLRGSEYANDAGWDLVGQLARMGSQRDPHGYRAEFLSLVDKAAGKAPPATELEPTEKAPQPFDGTEAPPAE